MLTEAQKACLVGVDTVALADELASRVDNYVILLELETKNMYLHNGKYSTQLGLLQIAKYRIIDQALDDEEKEEWGQ